MVSLRSLAALTSVSIALTSYSIVYADTVGLWLFDTMTDATFATATSGGDPIGGETLFDSSGNSLDLVSNFEGGSMLLDTDAPAVMGANTYSLESIKGGARLYKSPSSSMLHRGNTGELTIEFWFKSLSPPPTLGYIAAFDGGSSVDNVGNWDIYVDSDGNINFGTFSNPGNAFVAVKTDYTLGFDASDGNWHHLGFTINSAGTLAAYFDGNLAQQSTMGLAGPATTAQTDTLNLGYWRDSQTFGDHDFLIDELRISDAALLPGAGTGVNELAWNTQLGTVPPVLPPRSPDFGKNWIRSRDFVLSSWDSTKYYSQYTASGFNAVLGGGPEAIAAGVEDQYLGAFAQLDNMSRTDVQIALNQGVSAFMLKDEIPPGDIPGIGDVANYIRSVNDQVFLIAGLGSSGTAYIDNIAATIKPEAVLHAYYPFQGTTNATDDWGLALTNTALVRERTLFHDIAYFSYVQTFEDLLTGNNTVNDNRRLPTESEFWPEAFAKLSAGVKSLFFFRFQNNPLTEDIALIDPSGNPSALFAPAAAANTEFLNLGKSLRYLTSTDWRFVSGGVSATPASIPDWDANAGNGLIDAISISGPSLDRKDALVGYFTDDNNGEYFMLSNTYHGDSLDAAAATVSFTITFDSSISSIWRLNRLTGLAEELSLTGNILNLTLPGGTGDLFKFGDGLFAGLAVDNADFDGDGDVDGRDFLIWQRGFGTGTTLAQGDANGDMMVDENDLAIWQSQYASPLQAISTAVPEPTSALLLGIGMIVCAARCCRTNI